ncbi:MAG: helix-turn-helix domain-containing protein [Clostridiales bacterium]|jgi:transcriptional regulator with XRE-family HTH domain|nr:helix-turn-helix domain-containing protein [Clostridiales bacterium]
MLIFSKRIIELRSLNHFSQRHMAKFLDISQAAYFRYENGSAEPSQEMLVKIADIFDVTIDYLLGRAEY